MIKRLTKGYLSGNYATIDQKCDCKTSIELDFYDAINKLGQIEDLEEELGIDLITVFKALKNGIVGLDENGKINNFEVRGVKLNGLSVICPFAPYPECDLTFYFKDYGKWALTREGLEDETNVRS